MATHSNSHTHTYSSKCTHTNSHIAECLSQSPSRPSGEYAYLWFYWEKKNMLSSISIIGTISRPPGVARIDAPVCVCVCRLRYVLYLNINTVNSRLCWIYEDWFVWQIDMATFYCTYWGMQPSIMLVSLFDGAGLFVIWRRALVREKESQHSNMKVFWQAKLT